MTSPFELKIVVVVDSDSNNSPSPRCRYQNTHLHSQVVDRLLEKNDFSGSGWADF